MTDQKLKDNKEIDEKLRTFSVTSLYIFNAFLIIFSIILYCLVRIKKRKYLNKYRKKSLEVYKILYLFCYPRDHIKLMKIIQYQLLITRILETFQ